MLCRGKMQVYETMQTDLSQHWTLNMFNVPIILLLTIILFPVSQVKLLQFIQCRSGTVRRNDNRIYYHIIFNNTTNNSDHLCYTQDEKGFRAVLFPVPPIFIVFTTRVHCCKTRVSLLLSIAVGTAFFGFTRRLHGFKRRVPWP